MAALRVFPVLFFFFIFPFSSSSRHSFHDDRPSLLAFKTLITSDPFHSMANWNITVPLCNWSAVTCSHRHLLRATTLNLTSMDLSGSISPSLGNLSFLHILDLSGNALSGNIPTQLGRLFRLRELALMDNHLEGNIPNQLSGCKNLDLLGLSFNHLRGNIPRELGSLKHLQWLALGENNLTEYGLGENVSTRGDVYSYGILLLEMITRKQPTSNIFVADLNLHKWVNLAFPNRVKGVIDCSLFSEVDGDDFEENKVYKCLLSLIHIGLLCSKDSPNERPTMRDVVKMLETARQNLMENAIPSNRLRQSISNLIGDTNATMHNVTTLDDQSSSTF